jgi:hypothetical protein
MDRPPPYLRQHPEDERPSLGDAIVDIPDDATIAPEDQALRVELPDGGVIITIGKALSGPSEDASDHEANLAEHLDDGALGNIADDLLKKIDTDEQDQSRRLEDISRGLDILGIKLEEPRPEPNEEGMSVVRHPLLLEAVLRFQANARGEMLPADGPVKVRDDSDDTQREEDQANKLAKDFNHYLTVTATEYYPDTDRMFFSLGFGGEAYKKVYWCPIRRRPVSQMIDRKDIILSRGAVSIENNPRVTHRSVLSQSHVKRMMVAGAWRDVDLTYPSLADSRVVDEKLSNISGVETKSTLYPEERDCIVYECYCELDLPGYEHKEKGKETGLPLPYRVTIEKDSKEVLEIRRWWDEDDETCLRKEVFVEYVFVPAFEGVNLGLLHILGNSSRALTAAWRIALDNGMLANFPGGLIGRETGRQQTTNIRVAPGQLAPVDLNGGRIQDVVAPLPYRDVTSGFLGLIQDISNTAQRVGGTADTAVGEGRQAAPVGTTLALIEQAEKILGAVHKRMHQAQQKELKLLRDLFKEDPEVLIRGNRDPSLASQEVSAALANNDLVPASDPNTASQTVRVQKAIAVRELAMTNPTMYDMMAIDRRVMQMAGISDIDSLFTKVAPPPMQGDPSMMLKAQAADKAAEAKLAEVQIKAKTSEQDMQLRQQDAAIKAATTHLDAQNHAADRNADLAIEKLKLQREMVIHQHDAQLQREQQTHEQMLSHHDNRREEMKTAQDMQLNQQRHMQDIAMKQQAHATGLEQKTEAHKANLKMREEQAKQAAKQKVATAKKPS